MYFIHNRLRSIVYERYNDDMHRKDSQLNIRIDAELLSALRYLADLEVTTMSQLVRKAVTLYVRERDTGV